MISVNRQEKLKGLSMVVPAIVNGVETELLVDSGAMVTIVSPELLAKFPGDCSSRVRKTENRLS